ncbi:MAG: PQQ-binding-like beta-propeller repeat protein [Armatimonadetes bacterium]|nr:PQQ-binding-like beta-propeller repeat protein [Armatimonadota bacterium]
MRKSISMMLVGALAGAVVLWSGGRVEAQQGNAHAPVAIAADTAGTRLWVAESDGRRLVALDAGGKQLAQVALPGPATGLALNRDASTAFVTMGDSSVAAFDAATLKARGTWQSGYGVSGPVVSPDGATVYVCLRWTAEVAAIDAKTGKERARIKVLRQPTVAAITPDGAKLYVANLLSVDPSTAPTVAAEVSIVDTKTNKVSGQVRLPDGSHSLRGIALAPDGKTVYVAHLLSRYHLPTTQLERGWMNTNALSLIDTATDKRINTVLLDEVDRGSANPWAVGVSADGATLCVTSAGTHEVSLIDTAALRKKLDEAAKAFAAKTQTTAVAVDGYTETDGVSEDLTFLLGMRRRVALPINGPRSIAVAGGKAFSAGFYSDNIAMVDLASSKVESAKLLPEVPMSEVRRGDMFFADASLCFQNWQSCSSCHPDTRADGLNWDLLNDGIGNPKNTKSMLYTFKTPPAMSLGVRESVEAAVRAGIRVIQFAVRPEEDAKAIDEYLKSFKPQASPKLVNGKLSASAQRGKALFDNKDVGCSSCHEGPLFTSLKHYDVGLGIGSEAGKPFDTPTLIEAWRTGPYLHDGRAATLLDVITKCNPNDKHGKTSQLNKQQLADLAEYVGSL